MQGKKGKGGGTMSGKHSPMGKLEVESSVTNVSEGVRRDRVLGIDVPGSATNRPKKRG